MGLANRSTAPLRVYSKQRPTLIELTAAFEKAKGAPTAGPQPGQDNHRLSGLRQPRQCGYEVLREGALPLFYGVVRSGLLGSRRNNAPAVFSALVRVDEEFL